MSKQIVQQREMLFELFQVRIHGVVFLQESRLRGIGPLSQARMVGVTIFLKAQWPEQLQEQSHGGPG